MKIRLNLELLFVSLKTLLYQKGGGIKILDEKSLSKTIEWTPVDKLPQESFYWADGDERWTDRLDRAVLSFCGTPIRLALFWTGGNLSTTNRGLPDYNLYNGIRLSKS